MWARRVFALSLVMMTGGFGLFFEPGGRPLGRRAMTPSEPVFGVLSPPELSSASSGCWWWRRRLGVWRWWRK
jgi:hypothetical protein